jgi:hypothetical protein
MICDYFSYTTSKEISSPYFLKQMNIENIDKLDTNSPAFKDWINNDIF